ncbi:hypothetical protein CP980_31565 [Streptomyces vinaceus]|uniref:Lipoprotein n=1 Tax=Streptomyces vinaceus TaxID=1960 RepID=A0A5J6JG99_STRVI|nr:hypothetical protein [Streptomyces vinaceus]QEV49013.1 hypothetical protein CP980_31565 [Streptomyces vinaceus]GHE39259.1 hypothetical protein GCM10017778_23390 [Streptomyces vinaceus]
MPWTTTRPTAALSAVALAACGLLLAGCSSGAGAVRTAASASASASASSSPDAKAMDAYRQCLAQHGVTTAPRPTGTRGPGGGGWGGASGGPGRRASPDPQRGAAAQACADLRPQFNGRGGGSGGGDGSAMKAFTSCLKDHGVVLPSASPGAPGTRGFPGLPTSDPQSAQAFETCKALLPQRGPNTPAPGVSPSASAL